MSKLEPKPPEILQKIKWICLHGKKHKKYIIIASIFLFVSWFITSGISVKHVKELLLSKSASSDNSINSKKETELEGPISPPALDGKPQKTANPSTSLETASTNETQINEAYRRQKDGTIVDTRLNLVWRADIEGLMTWSEAINHIKQTNESGLLGHHDWRLSNKAELVQWSKFTRRNKGFFLGDDIWHWSSTEKNLLTAWVVNPGHAELAWDDMDESVKGADINEPYAVRLVRQLKPK